VESSGGCGACVFCVCCFFVFWGGGGDEGIYNSAVNDECILNIDDQVKQ